MTYSVHEHIELKRGAARLVLLAPVLQNVAYDKQRETAAERVKKGPSTRRYTQQPVRHWDHWLHENVDLPNTHVIAYAPDAPPRLLRRLSGFRPADWADVESCTVPSTDDVSIQFFFVKPKGATTRLPTLLWIHGGPIGMDADGWHWRWNPLLMVAQGYAVALPNPRGSTGFGQAFIQGIWGNVWGDQCYQDLMCVTDALETRADVDPQRIMAMGGSFGGYMTNWSRVV